MGITQHLINKINSGNKKYNTDQSKKKSTNDFFSNETSKSKKLGTKGKTIGFLFFNSGVMLTLGNEGKNQKILINDSNDQYSSNIQGFTQ